MFDIVFYDGNCALCHGLVLFLLKRDPKGQLFRFAPLGGTEFQNKIDSKVRETLPDSVVVKASDGRVLIRSEGVCYLLKRIGAAWGMWGSLILLLPRPIRDFGYDFIARVRYQVFGKKTEVCPLVPSNLKERFLI